MYIIIDSIILYDLNKWQIDSDITVEKTQVIHKDLFGCEYKYICNYENGKNITINDNELSLITKKKKYK